MATDTGSPFSINSMNMRDAETGELLWECGKWDLSSKLLQATIPKKILKCKAVSREINFSSKNAIKKLKLKQTVVFMGQEIEVWEFDFGFVIPGSTNSWQQTITAADNVMTAEQLSGNLEIHTVFSDGEKEVSKSAVRIFYK
mmetsp:Transcript_41973/g.82876  ORF Transcript_41973/g.82876 Transcript_41973/m.82876 type:complete len:142 (+) Transcript_41973:390-815(+)